MVPETAGKLPEAPRGLPPRLPRSHQESPREVQNASERPPRDSPSLSASSHSYPAHTLCSLSFDVPQLLILYGVLRSSRYPASGFELEQPSNHASSSPLSRARKAICFLTRQRRVVLSFASHTFLSTLFPISDHLLLYAFHFNFPVHHTNRIRTCLKL